MSNESKLLSRLLQRATQDPEQSAFIFIDEASIEYRLTYAQLFNQATALAKQLMDSGYSQQPVVLYYPSGLDYVVAVYACLLAGTTLVPACPRLDKRQAVDRFERLLQSIEPAVVLTTAEQYIKFKTINTHLDTLTRSQWFATDVVIGNKQPKTASWPNQTASNILLQGVRAKKANRQREIINIDQLDLIVQRLQNTIPAKPGDVMVSWLALHSRLGLISSVLLPTFSGLTCVFMSPSTFIHQPLRWLKMISYYQAKHSMADKFSLLHCIKKWNKADSEGLNLEHWQNCYLDKQSMDPDILEQFIERFYDDRGPITRFIHGYNLVAQAEEKTSLDPSVLNQYLS